MDVLAAAVVVVCTVAVVEVSVPVEMRPALAAVVLAKSEVDAAYVDLEHVSTQCQHQYEAMCVCVGG